MLWWGHGEGIFRRFHSVGGEGAGSLKNMWPWQRNFSQISLRCWKGGSWIPKKYAAMASGIFRRFLSVAGREGAGSLKNMRPWQRNFSQISCLAARFTKKVENDVCLQQSTRPLYDDRSNFLTFTTSIADASPLRGITQMNRGVVRSEMHGLSA